jgi:hypothetical protein
MRDGIAKWEMKTSRFSRGKPTAGNCCRGGHLVGAPKGLLDEIFQAGRPVRVGLDTASTDCRVRNGAI